MPQEFPAGERLAARDDILDLVRGLSALVVLLSHSRNFFMKDFGELADPGHMAMIFYLLSGLGHQAVMVFFVLSGYFVGGSVLSGLQSGRFLWSRYSLARLTRLWVVLVPALLLTLVCDLSGRWLAGPAAYAGSLHGVFGQGPSVSQPAMIVPSLFLGNLMFLQTVRFPVYGSNGPLWSLAYEFWYYAIFPLIAAALYPCKTKPGGKARPLLIRILMLATAVALLWILPRELVKGGLVWLFGIGVWWMVRQPRWMQVFRSWVWGGVGALVFGSVLIGCKLGWGGCSDFTLGLAFAAWLPSLVGIRRFPACFKALATVLADHSYTLYVVHFPLLFFLAVVVTKGHQFDFGGTGVAIVIGSCLLALALTRVCWLCFEGNTERVRQWAAGFLPKTPASPANHEVDLPAARIA